MTITAYELLLYAGGMAALWAIPGPVWVALTARSLSSGMRGAWPLAIGVAMGDLVWPLCAIFGLAWVLSLYGDFLSLLRWVAAVLTVLGLSALWATFRVPGDASASGGAPFAVPGPVRLGLELVVLLGAGVALAVTGSPGVGLGLAGLVVAHYVATRDRVRWLLDDPARSDGHPSPRQDTGSRPTS